MTKKAYAYLRVSTEEQVTNFSLSNQEDYCFREAERQEFDIIHTYREEGVSAKTTNRPELLRLLEDCRLNKGTISAVFIYKIDRLSRETFDFLAIKKKLAEYGIRIISVTELTEDNPAGEFIETLFAASAKLDNATKSLRTRDGMRKRLESGWAIGKAPVGYLNVESDGKQIIAPDEEQFDFVKLAWEKMATGAYSLETIIPIFNKLGIKIKRGAKLIPITRNQQTQRIFRDKFYAGYVVSEKFGISILGKHKPMVTDELFMSVQKIIDQRSYTGGMKYQKLNDNFPLRGHLICGVCGSKMTGSFSKGRNGRYPYYFCGSRIHKSRSFPRSGLELEFVEHLKTIEPKPELLLLFKEMIKEKWQSRYSAIEARQKALHADLKALKELRSRLVEKNLKGVYSDEVFQEQQSKIEGEILVKKSLISESRLDKIDIDIVLNFFENFLLNLSKFWVEGTVTQRQAITGSIFPNKLVYDNPGFRTDDLGLCFKLIKRFDGSSTSFGVANGDRTRDIRLHKPALYH